MKHFLIAASCLLALTSLPTGLAQEAPEAMGQLVFTDVPTKTTASVNAGDVIFYAMQPGEPAGKATKVYLQRSVFAVGWTDSFAFEWVADRDLQLTGKAKVQVTIGCDLPVVFRPMADTPAANPRAFSFSLWQGTKTLASTGWNPSAPACQPGTLIPGEIEVDTTEAAVSAGDLLRVGVGIWNSNFFGGKDPARSLFIQVGDAEAPSRVMAAGLPGLAAPAAEVLALETEADSASAAPGKSAAFSLTVGNSGSSDASFDLQAVDLPEGFEATFDPQSGAVAPGASTMSNLSVAVPADAKPGSVPFSIEVTGPNGGNASLALTLEVVAAGAGPTGTPAPTGGTATSPAATNGTTGDANATDNATGAPKEEDTGGDTPGPSLALAALSLGAASWIGRRRRRA